MTGRRLTRGSLACGSLARGTVLNALAQESQGHKLDEGEALAIELGGIVVRGMMPLITRAPFVTAGELIVIERGRGAIVADGVPVDFVAVRGSREVVAYIGVEGEVEGDGYGVAKDHGVSVVAAGVAEEADGALSRGGMSGAGKEKQGDHGGIYEQRARGQHVWLRLRGMDRVDSAETGKTRDDVPRTVEGQWEGKVLISASFSLCSNSSQKDSPDLVSMYAKGSHSDIHWGCIQPRLVIGCI